MKQDTHIHRFHEQVAISVGGGETVYYTAKEARKIAAGVML